MGYEPDDWGYILSTVCNAYFSDLEFEELVDFVMLSSNKEELDAAVTATIRLWEIVNYEEQ
jgi:hypothetical protein